MEERFVTANHDHSLVQAIPPVFVIMTVKHFQSHVTFVYISDFVRSHRDLGFIFAIFCP